MSPYNFPSGEKLKFDLNNIETSLRRDRRKKRFSLFEIAGSLGVVAILVVIGWLIFFTPEVEAQVPEIIYASETYGKEDFCRQALIDHEYIGREITGDLKEYCL